MKFVCDFPTSVKSDKSELLEEIDLGGSLFADFDDECNMSCMVEPYRKHVSKSIHDMTHRWIPTATC